MSKFKVAVLGPIPRDHITTHQGETIEKYGCVMHTAIGLSRLLGQDGVVIPVSHVRKVDRGPILEILKDYTNIETDHIRSDEDQGDIIQLCFLDQNKRVEKQTGFMNPILPDDVRDLVDCDVVVCVPITDYEVPLETLKFLKSEGKPIIIFDAHGPTNTVSAFGDRVLRFWIDRDQWLPYIDVLKMNLEESTCCWFEKEYEVEQLTNREDSATDHLPLFASHALNHGVRAVIVTLDSNGSSLFRLQDGELVHTLIEAIRVENVVDTTGCGDSFAGGLGYGMLADPENFIRAVHYANALGAQRTQGRTFEVFKSLDETRSMIKRFYGEA